MICSDPNSETGQFYRTKDYSPSYKGIFCHFEGFSTAYTFEFDMIDFKAIRTMYVLICTQLLFIVYIATMKHSMILFSPPHSAGFMHSKVECY